MSFDPRNAERASDFFIKFGDGAEEVDIVRLPSSSCSGASNHLHFTDSGLAIYDPAEFAAMRQPPEPGDSGNQEEGSGKTAKFTSCGRC